MCKEMQQSLIYKLVLKVDRFFDTCIPVYVLNFIICAMQFSVI
jgi:hypothetical protein